MKLTLRAMLAILLLLVAAVPAQAAPDPARVYQRVAQSGNPEAEYASLTNGQRKAFDKYVTPTSTTESDIAPQRVARAQALATTTCWRSGHKILVKNFLGAPIYSYNMYVEWCGNGSSLQYTYMRAYGETYILFWSWREVGREKSVNTAPNPDQWTAWAQAEFKVCMFGDIGCVSYYYPWISFRGVANGSHAWNASN